jgi:hypothetical protein
MKQPQNYQELLQKAVRETELKVWELDERAKNMRKFHKLVKDGGVTDWASYERALDDTQIDDHGDEEDLTFISEIANNWPEVSYEPGEGGYW